ncbi:MAG TPA: acetylglutamate kinase [Chloroflexota bacterium]|jgi:acetylglutamate kinase|nr:acetylglutamate kinase [Chloroflexota bacterium]
MTDVKESPGFESIRGALPRIAHLIGKSVVLKVGGSVGLEPWILEDIAWLHRVGVQPVVVHGGGPMISDWQARLGYETRFVEGRRYTDEHTLDVVRAVLIGIVNSDLVGGFSALGVPAVGLSGLDGGLIQAAVRDPKLGLVGDVMHIDLRPMRAMQEAGYLVVVAPVGRDENGSPLNINADTVAGDIARALHAEKLIFFTDVPGVLDREGKVIPTLSSDQVWDLIGSGEIHGGMIPKVEACVRGLDTVTHAHIIDGRVPNALLRAFLTDEAVGTMFTAEAPSVPQAHIREG